MASSQYTEDCQVTDPKNTYAIDADSSLRLPLDGSMCIVFTGHFNGVGVEIRSPDEMTLLSHMGCFGKGSASRSKPKNAQCDSSPSIMRKRQFLIRNYWFKKFGKPDKVIESDCFIRHIDNIIAKIVDDAKQRPGRDVIDLVSSEDENSNESGTSNQNECYESDKQNIVVIVPNSDSEDENYFANIKPKCCINKANIQEKLILTLEEAFFLLYGLGCLQIIYNEHTFTVGECWKAFSNSNSQFVERYVVYHYFRSKGYIVKSGIKFGGDYLLYKEGPSVNHADYIVVINYGDDTFNWIAILGHIRMATTTAKEVIVAEVIKPNKENLDLPEDLREYRVRELVLTRKLPVKINDTED